jgi:hypothetical protein
VIFVFGSNLSGIHAGGAARAAHQKYGAAWGVGEGITGLAYALPTKGHNMAPMSIAQVERHVVKFLAYAQEHPKLRFQVTRVGCGLAGFKDEDIAPLFKDAPSNCEFDEFWLPYLPVGTLFWGKF